MGRDSRFKLVGPTGSTTPDDTGISAQLLERFGRPVLVGAIYTFAAALPIPLTVKSITPMLEPNAPPDSYRVTLVGQVELMMFARAPYESLQYVGGLKAATKTPPVDAPPADPNTLDNSPAGDPPAAAPAATTGITLTDAPPIS